MVLYVAYSVYHDIGESGTKVTSYVPFHWSDAEFFHGGETRAASVAKPFNVHSRFHHLEPLRLTHIRRPKSSGQDPVVRGRHGISATSQSSTCKDWGFLGSSEFRAFPMTVLVSSSNGCAIRRAFSRGDKGPCDNWSLHCGKYYALNEIY
jgi:hypothetical protein